MITRENYHQAIAKIDFRSLPGDFQEGHEIFIASEKFPKKDEAIEKILDDYLETLNDYLNFQKGNKEPSIRDFYNMLSKNEVALLHTVGFNPQRQKLADELSITLQEVIAFDKKIRPRPKSGTAKPKGEPKLPKAKSKQDKREPSVVPTNQVVVLTEEIKFIKRYIGFHKKVKPLASFLSFIKALQRAIILKQIKKSSIYADDIRSIQARMVKVYNSYDHEERFFRVVINDEDLARYVGIVGGESVYKSVGIIKKFIGMQGKEVEQKTVDAYLKSIKKANLTDEDPYFDKVQTIVDLIRQKQDGKAIRITEQELNGLMGILNGCGCKDLGTIYNTRGKELRKCHSDKYSDARKGACSHHRGLKPQKNCKELNGIMTAEEVAGMQYEKLPFDGKWKDLLGLPATNFDMMVFGQPGSGKTTFLLLFAHYLATKFGNVLYVSGEEYDSSPLTEKVNALPSIPSRLVFGRSLNKLPIPLYNFQFVILDSVTDLGIDIETYKSLREQNPDTAFILILQTTKDGKFKGGKEWEHEVEIAGEIEDGTISIYKNRYGVKGQLNFFEDNN